MENVVFEIFGHEDLVEEGGMRPYLDLQTGKFGIIRLKDASPPLEQQTDADCNYKRFNAHIVVDAKFPQMFVLEGMKTDGWFLDISIRQTENDINVYSHRHWYGYEQKVIDQNPESWPQKMKGGGLRL